LKTFRVFLVTHKRTERHWQKHNLLGGGNRKSWILVAKYPDAVPLILNFLPCYNKNNFV